MWPQEWEQHGLVRLTDLRLCAVKKASTLSPGCTVTYSCVGVNFQGMSSATSAVNHTRICSKQQQTGTYGNINTAPLLAPQGAFAPTQLLNLEICKP